ncbi:outer membrane beta-barrel protein [Flammeovirga sp. OC4]|uniref:outer membrane beta-barrel protein n=1 Tax=Flammeovirga sp. OC4 TaxID=1382345 RepID=UPI0005C63A51|nr:outer membrane beta-barrel protein [Flammeovirga sp. OC4]
MKKLLLLLSTVLLSINIYAQISFERGYYINNSNRRVGCYIKNTAWKNNPSKFEYRSSLNGRSKKISITSVKEFGIGNSLRYVRKTVNIDRSSGDGGRLTSNKNAIFKQETLFLRILIKGKGTLYQYSDGNLERFFYSKDGSEVEQLVFKKFLINGSKIGTNNNFKEQLWDKLGCSDLDINDIVTLRYERSDLVNYFIKYNRCEKSKFVNYNKAQEKDTFHISFRPGLNVSSLSIENTTGIIDWKNADFGTRVNFRLGFEAEIVLPFNKNKWALIVEPTYHYFTTEKELSNQSVSINYSSLQFPFGIRHYFFLKNKSSIFFNASYNMEMLLGSEIDYETGNDLEIAKVSNFAFGLGYKPKKGKYSMELRYMTPKDILSNKSFWVSDYQTFSVIFGFSLF